MVRVLLFKFGFLVRFFLRMGVEVLVSSWVILGSDLVFLVLVGAFWVWVVSFSFELVFCGLKLSFFLGLVSGFCKFGFFFWIGFDLWDNLSSSIFGFEFSSDLFHFIRFEFRCFSFYYYCYHYYVILFYWLRVRRPWLRGKVFHILASLRDLA